jgi:hypothetical protein
MIGPTGNEVAEVHITKSGLLAVVDHHSVAGFHTSHAALSSVGKRKTQQVSFVHPGATVTSSSPVSSAQGKHQHHDVGRARRLTLSARRSSTASSSPVADIRCRLIFPDARSHSCRRWTRLQAGILDGDAGCCGQ